MAAGGLFGRYLRIDLTTGTARFVPIPEAVQRRTIGGVGLGAWILLREAPAGVDPLAPEAPIVFALSPLVGTPLTTSAKFAVVAKSPLTYRINDALSSSHFAIAAKRAGFDALVIVGDCKTLSALVIDGLRIPTGDASQPGAVPSGAVDIIDAADLGGLSAAAAERRLKERLADRSGGPPFATAAIGPAGENLVRFASLSNEGRHAGRGGLGAVLGSKRLKAVAVRGRHAVPLADAAAVNAFARDLSARSFGPATEKYRELGTVANLLVFNRLAVLPTRNFQESTFEAAESLSAESLAQVRGKTRSSCAACTIGCEHVFGVRRESGSKGAGASETGVRMEYESLFALGPLCGVSDREAVLEAAAVCDELGLDTISAGGTIAFAMECADRGLIAPDRFPAPIDPPAPGRSQRSAPEEAVVPGESAIPENTSAPGGPLALKFGDGRTMIALLGMIARREGIGHLLAEGTRRAARAIGGEAPRFAPHVKGLEIPGYEPRALQAMALGFAVGTRGADHNRSSAYEVDFSDSDRRFHGDAETARRAIETEDRAALMDSLILCKFLRGVFTDLFAESAALLRAVTGWDVTADELHETARRTVTARKWFNEREGWTPTEDTLPDRFLDEALTQGASRGARLDREALAVMIRAYNEARGFTPEGRVPPAMRHQLGLEP